MNQETLKQLLLTLEKDLPDFSVIFTGKKSRRVNGLYKPELRQILIHNRNFTDDNALIYTGIHELAHHIHFSRYPEEVRRRAHTNRFWQIFHTLLERAEAKGVYYSVFESDPAFQELTVRIRRDFLARNGSLMKEFGQVLMEAMELCRQKNAVFEDYAERVLGMKRGSARTLIKLHTLNVDSSLGYEKMKVVASVPDRKLRSQITESFRSGATEPQVRQTLKDFQKGPRPDADKADKEKSSLEAKKRRLEKNIMKLQAQLAEIERQLEEL